jgi:uncharacterized membrane protein YeaQ/YmgE (transglycosylase-associated protein family)
MSLLAWILVGLIAGWLAGAMMGSRTGVVGDMVIGVVGALLGGFLASALFEVGDPLSGFNLPTLVTAFLGAVVLIALVRALPGRSPV